MAISTRKNAWNQNGTFDNTDLLWYAKGVGVMQSRKFNDPTSWWFFAAMHGQYLVDHDHPGTPVSAGYPNWANIPGPPDVPKTPLPSLDLISKYWDQCQHGTWFFPPWHRGYLYAIENILRDIIKSLEGPVDWALPYWNYFGKGNEYKIPPAFTQQTLPDGSPNPLLVKARFGPNNDGNVFIPIGPQDINQQCQQTPFFTGGNDGGTSGDYGGGATGFEHGDSLFGDLEWNPHNSVHGAVGGQFPSGKGGLMGYPRLAALDPVFYLHHSNIDRMWAAWNKAGNSNPTDPKWINGPTAMGDRKFIMPNPDLSHWQYTPGMVNSISQLNYTYEDLSLGVPAVSPRKNTLRLRNLGFIVNNDELAKNMDRHTQSELVGASKTPLIVDASGGRTLVKLDSAGWNTVANSLQTASLTSYPDEVYLLLEGAKGNEDSIVCSVSVNHYYAGHIYLFGLQTASEKDGPHGGAGLTIKLDITKIVDQLHLDNTIDTNSLDVLIQPVNIIAKGSELTVSRIGIYRIGQKQNK